MLPTRTAAELNALGHDALSVRDAGLVGAPDEDVYLLAVAETRAVVTENFADFAVLVEERIDRGEPCVPVVFVRKRSFPRAGALTAHLARHLDAWAGLNPDPFPGIHWP